MNIFLRSFEMRKNYAVFILRILSRKTGYVTIYAKVYFLRKFVVELTQINKFTQKRLK